MNFFEGSFFLEKKRREAECVAGTYGLLHLDSVDVHLGTRILKRIVEHEHVVVVHIFSSWTFFEHLFLPACQALKRGPQYPVL
jgi:hypothetical protein